MSTYNQDLLDALTLVSFLVGVANYQENLTQSDKDDILRKLDTQTREILQNIQDELEKQSCLLRMILAKLEGGKDNGAD